MTQKLPPGVFASFSPRQRRWMKQCAAADARLCEPLLRLPIADGQRRYVSNHPGLIHTAFLHGSDLPATAEERQRLWAYAWLIRAEAYRAIYANPRIRNPVAYAVANQTAVAYEDLTGRQMTSVTDPYREGYPEVGKFARLVGEIFAILAIDASPAGHVKRLINQRKCARGLSFD